MARRRYVEGLAEVRRVFAAAPAENIERITDALNRGGKEIEAAARQAVPVGDGDLRDSLRTIEASEIRVRRDDRAAVVYVTAGRNADGTNRYARAQEFGRAASDGHPGHAAQPFFFPAYWSVRRRVRSRIKREIRRAARALAAMGRRNG